MIAVHNEGDFNVSMTAGTSTKFYKGKDWEMARKIALGYLVFIGFIALMVFYRLINRFSTKEDFSKHFTEDLKFLGLLAAYSLMLWGIFYWKNICLIYVLNLFHLIILVEVLEAAVVAIGDGRQKIGGVVLLISVTVYGLITYSLILAYREIKSFLLYRAPQRITSYRYKPVSYTHLTLPTIYSV
eukprot:TRINITY_DN3213_c0_g3_i2.p1 TRINITY_DN3213_c0_g3~~TRINITY_DN3213_c0_g3_i2.p1  ORF type:complete len:185 (+),score=22.77 TRINITY_DN3213_c0_g3_i2:78-632(+)